MPPRFAVISDSSCDLSPEEADRSKVTLVPFYVSFDGVTYRREGVEMAIQDFYEEMVRCPGVFPKTSMPSMEDYLGAFRPLAEAGTPALCLCISTKFSGSYGCAVTAAGLLREEYPQWELRVMDSRLATALQGELGAGGGAPAGRGLRTGGGLPAAGGGDPHRADSLHRWQPGLPEDRRAHRQGGLRSHRGSGGQAPSIVLKEGEIFPDGIFRSGRRGKARLVDLTRRYLLSCGDDPAAYRFITGYGYDYREAQAFRDDMLAMLGELCGLTSLGIAQIGATIGVHTGPHPLGVGLLKRA